MKSNCNMYFLVRGGRDLIWFIIKKVRFYKFLFKLMRNKIKFENGFVDEDIVVEFVEFDGGKRGYYVYEVFCDDFNLWYFGWFVIFIGIGLER